MKEKLMRVTICLDNPAMLLGLRNQKTKPSHYLLDVIHNLLEDFQVTQARMQGVTIEGYRRGKGRMRLKDSSKGWKEWNLKRSCTVEFIWTPSHKDIFGNETADTEAKRAAQGKMSPLKDLPLLLQKKPLPISIAATRQAMRKSAKLRWKNEWFLSPHYTKTNKIDNSLPSNDYLHIINQLHRNQTSILTQFRTGHIPLNVILHRIRKSNSPDCPHCGPGYRETVFHYLLVCPHYTNARRVLQANLNSEASSIPFLLSTRTGIPHLLCYISDMKHFRTTLGEVCPDDDFALHEKNEPKTLPPPNPPNT